MRHYSPKAHISSARGFRARAAQAAALALILSPAVSAATVHAAAVPTFPTTHTSQKTDSAFGVQPLRFEPNVGQSGSGVRFIAHTPSATLLFGQGEVGMLFKSAQKSTYIARSQPSGSARLQFFGANTAATLLGGTQLPGYSNYIAGTNSSSAHTGVPAYATFTYKDLYTGVDLEYANAGGNLKGTYTVAPTADPAVIQWSYSRAEKMALDAQGNLQITLNPGGPTLTEAAPVAWQENSGKRTPVAASYRLNAEGMVSFNVGAYNHSLPLTLDPVIYSSYLGGGDFDQANAVATDSTGNIYMAGTTQSAFDFPTTPGAYQTTLYGTSDVFVAKLDSTGHPIYTTFIGGNGSESATGIAVDSGGNAYITGLTNAQGPSFPYPTTPGAFQTTYAGGSYDAFVTKLNPAGSALVYSSFLGGGSIEQGNGIAVDGAGNAYVTGATRSANFIGASNSMQGYQDGFVVKVNPTGSALGYSRYLGGTSANAEDTGNGIAADGAGNAYVVGTTDSTDFPTTPGAFQTAYAGGFDDVFVTKLSTSGSLSYSTYIGGSTAGTSVGDDFGFGIAVDGSGSAVVTGETNSSNFPANNPATFGGGYDAFITRLNPAGSALVGSRFLGGTHNDYANAVALDASGNIYITGKTTGNPGGDFPTLNPDQPSFGGGLSDAFVAAIRPDAQGLAYSTYLGGGAQGQTTEDIGLAIAAGPGGVYVTGETSSSNFPTVNPIQPTYRTGGDAFITRYTINIPPAPTPTNTPVPTTCPVQFSDVPASSPFYPFIRCLACRNVMGGYPDGTFRPSANISRGQLAKIVANAAAINDPAGPQLFEDVAPGSTFYDFVQRLTNRGVMGGYPCGGAGEPCRAGNKPYFRPGNNATRGQIAKIVSSTRGYSEQPTNQTFEDVPTNSAFYLFIERLVFHGVMSGYPCGGSGEPCRAGNKPYFRPSLNASRGQVSKIVSNTFFPNCQSLRPSLEK